MWKPILLVLTGMFLGGLLEFFRQRWTCPVERGREKIPKPQLQILKTLCDGWKRIFSRIRATRGLSYDDPISEKDIAAVVSADTKDGLYGFDIAEVTEQDLRSTGALPPEDFDSAFAELKRRGEISVQSGPKAYVSITDKGKLALIQRRRDTSA